MRILALERKVYTADRPDLPSLLRDEAAAVWELMKRGIIRDIWFTAPDRTAVAMLECANLASAREHLDALPLVRSGHIVFDLRELRSYDGFERLFAAPPETPPRP